MNNKKPKYKLGLALGGGGARGFVHLGVLEGLREKGIYPDILSGTSAGSIAGAFIADGQSPKEAFDLLKAKDFFGYTTIQWPTDGLFSLDGLAQVLKTGLSVDRIEETKIPFIPTVTNLNLGTTEYLEEGDLVESVLASASIPFLFSPVDINGHKYADGGILDNLPVKPLLSQCKHILAVSISPVRETDDLDSLIKVAARTFQLSVNAQNLNISQQCTYFIEPEGIEKYDLFDNEKADELFELGYKCVQKMDIDQLTD